MVVYLHRFVSFWFHCFSQVPLRGWFKGADTVCLLDFLESSIGQMLDSLDETIRPVFLEIHAAISAANAFMRCIYNAALWLTEAERDFLLRSGGRCVNSFQKCATRAYAEKNTRWKFMPKYHCFGELLFSLRREKNKGQPSINPLMFCTQQDEDFVGKVSFLSRTVSVRTVHARTLDRYLVALASKWWCINTPNGPI